VKVQWKSTGILLDTLVRPLSWPKGSLTRLLPDFYQTLSGLSLDFHQTHQTLVDSGGLSLESARVRPDNVGECKVLGIDIKSKAIRANGCATASIPDQ